MSMITITNSEKFEAIINKIEQSSLRISALFSEEGKIFENINATDIWTGKAQKVVYNKYKDLEKNFAPIEETLKIYVAFLKNTLDSYKRHEENVINNTEINEFNLDINS